jgi:serine phosphatase RsbU (regulator of sigma subunit)
LQEEKELNKQYSRALALYGFWVAVIAVMIMSSPGSGPVIVLAVLLLALLWVRIKGLLDELKAMKDLCGFYERAHSLDDLQLLQEERPYRKILDTVLELGKFDWVVLFLMDYEKDCFVAVEAAGVKLERFGSVSFDEIAPQHSADGMKLSMKLLEHAFKLHEFKGALAGTVLGRNNTFYGSMLVGRDDHDSELTPEDSFRLDILSDQISICLHNYRLHKELALRAEEMSERQSRIQRELEMARIVQDGVMPRQIPEIAGVKMASFLKPARFIGGDFLRFGSSGEKKQQILLGDVCGKGVPAALVMAVVVCLFKEKGDLYSDPAALMTAVNCSLKEFLGAGSRFNSTAFYGILDLEQMKFAFANAGHDFPLLYSAARDEIVELASTGTLLGIFAESSFSCTVMDIGYGDCIFFYSDGLIDFFEASTGCEDGYEYLKNFFSQRCQKKSGEIVKEISTLVENSPASVKDDITVAVFSIEKKNNWVKT